MLGKGLDLSRLLPTETQHGTQTHAASMMRLFDRV